MVKQTILDIITKDKALELTEEIAIKGMELFGFHIFKKIDEEIEKIQKELPNDFVKNSSKILAMNEIKILILKQL